MARQKSENGKLRATFLLGVDVDGFVRFVASSRHINLSSAMNLLVTSVLQGDFSMLNALVSDYNSRRQF